MESYIKFEEEKHQYFDPEGNEYTSVSRVLGEVKAPFERNAISIAVAKRDGLTQEAVLADWDAKRDSAAEWGTKVHNGLESWFKDRVLTIEDPSFQKALAYLDTLFGDYHMCMEEYLLHSKAHHVAGTADKVCFRQRSQSPVVDYWDYKTNEAKGITYDSIGVDKKTGRPKHYNRYMQKPVAHLEDCLFSQYSLQLSIYALLGEIENGWKPGKLAIVFIDKLYHCTIIPVPYMRAEALAILDLYKKNIKKEKKQSTDWSSVIQSF